PALVGLTRRPAPGGCTCTFPPRRALREAAAAQCPARARRGHPRGVHGHLRHRGRRRAHRVGPAAARARSRRLGDRGADARRQRARDASTQSRRVSGTRLLWRDTVSRAVVLTMTALVLAAGAVNVAEVFLIKDSLQACDLIYGVVSAMWMAGMVVGSSLTPR